MSRLKRIAEKVITALDEDAAFQLLEKVGAVKTLNDNFFREAKRMNKYGLVDELLETAGIHEFNEFVRRSGLITGRYSADASKVSDSDAMKVVREADRVADRILAFAEKNGMNLGKPKAFKRIADRPEEDKVMRTVVRGPISLEDLKKIAGILRDTKTDQDEKIKEIATVRYITPEAASILVSAWYDGGRYRLPWQDRQLYLFIKQRLITKLGKDIEVMTRKITAVFDNRFVLRWLDKNLGRLSGIHEHDVDAVHGEMIRQGVAVDDDRYSGIIDGTLGAIREEMAWTGENFSHCVRRLVHGGTIAREKTAMSMNIHDLDWVSRVLTSQREKLDESGMAAKIAELRQVPQQLAERLVEKWEHSGLWRTYMNRLDMHDWIRDALGMPMLASSVARELAKIAKELSAAAILRVDAWRGDKPEISVHNRWYIVNKTGTDLGRLTGVSDLNGWIVTKIVPNQYIIVTSPDGAENEIAVGFAQHIASELKKVARELMARMSNVPTKREVQYYLYKPRGDYFMEVKPDGLYLTLYDMHDAHTIFSNLFQGYFNAESLHKTGDTFSQYRITRKVP